MRHLRIPILGHFDLLVADSPGQPHMRLVALVSSTANCAPTGDVNWHTMSDKTRVFAAAMQLLPMTLTPAAVVIGPDAFISLGAVKIPTAEGCASDGCGYEPAWHVFWPGQPQAGMCNGCCARANAVAAAMGFVLVTQQIDSPMQVRP